MKAGLLALAKREHGGIVQYTLTLIEAFAMLARAGRLDVTALVTSDFDDREEWTGVERIRLGRIRLNTRLAMYLGRPLDGIPDRTFDVAVSPKTCLAGLRMARRSIVTLHDMQHRRLPHFFSWRRRMQRDWLYRQTVSRVDAIVCETEYVKRDIIAAYDKDPAAIHVIPSPPPQYVLHAKLDDATMRRVREGHRLPPEYLFYPAQFWPHKNHAVLVEAMDILRTAGVDLPLILVGAPRESFGPTMKRVSELGLSDRVRYLGYVPDAEMPYLFKGATMLVVPSLFESLSFPVWEAFHFGIPVVASNACAFPEQVGNAGLLFDPHSPEDCAAQIRRCLEDRALASQLVARGGERMAAMTMEGYAARWWATLSRVTSR